MKQITVSDVLALSAAMPEPYGALVLLLGFCGLRFGEAAALAWSAVDLKRGTVEITASAYELSSGQVITTPGKTRAAVRVVPIPEIVVSALSAMTITNGDLFSGIARRSNFRRDVWNPAMDDAGVTIKPHDLRRFAAAIWVQAGADPLEIARRLGHARRRGRPTRGSTRGSQRRRR